MLNLFGTDPVEVGDALVAVAESQEGLSTGVIVVTRDLLMASVEIGYVGAGDQQEAEALSEKAAARMG